WITMSFLYITAFYFTTSQADTLQEIQRLVKAPAKVMDIAGPIPLRDRWHVLLYNILQRIINRKSPMAGRKEWELCGKAATR
ncbi:MAG TPA: hypothetical protein PLD49_04965, partial [Thermoclostridium caenicola]|uniref:hypothetical protein n=1 Tax=Thermoclostridium caenicola TaxID=659425 RepID=UPI002BAE0D24